MRTVVTLRCLDCPWGWCTDQVTRDAFGFRYDYPPPHDCPGGGENIEERVGFDVELVTRAPGLNVRMLL